MALPSQHERGIDNGRPRSGSSKLSTVAIATFSLLAVAGGVWGWMQYNKPTETKDKLPGKSTPGMDLAQPGPSNVPQAGLGSLVPQNLAPQNQVPQSQAPQGQGQPATNPSGTPSSTPGAAPGSTPGGTPGGPPSTAPGSASGTAPGSAPGATPNPGSTTPSTANPPANPPATTGPSVDPATGKPASTDVTKPSLTPGAPNPNSNPGGPGAPGNTLNPNGPSVSPSGPLTPTGPTDEIRAAIADGDRKKAAGDLVGARAIYSRVLMNSKTPKSDQDALRSTVATINDELFFSTKVVAGDPIAETYAVQAGDNPTKIAKKNQLATDAELIEQINKVKATSLKVGQKLKLIRGPFNAIVHKGDFRVDLFWGPPSDPDSWLYIKSFKAGLGTNNGTPVGEFIVKSGSKLRNPPWTNPQTGEKFPANDPKNPIGKRWIGLEGLGESAKFKGYGLHGTIDPSSIGQQKSMGCVRLGDDDINFLFDVLADGVSAVKIQP